MITDLQRIQIKLLTNAPHDLRLEPFLDIFGRWRHDKPAENSAGWVDVADYAHVARGPGILLAGYHAHFSFDMADPAPGSLYYARKGLSGSTVDRVSAALKVCLELTKRLAAEPEFPPGIEFRTDCLELHFPDRLETPNMAETDTELHPVVQRALDMLYGLNGYSLTPHEDPKQPYGFSVWAKSAEPLDTLLHRLTRTAQS